MDNMMHRAPARQMALEAKETISCARVCAIGVGFWKEGVDRTSGILDKGVDRKSKQAPEAAGNCSAVHFIPSVDK